MSFRYDAKIAAKIEEERKIQGEIDEEKSCKYFQFLFLTKNYFEFF
jgi:hypothetical protein